MRNPLGSVGRTTALATHPSIGVFGRPGVVEVLFGLGGWRGGHGEQHLLWIAASLSVWLFSLSLLVRSEGWC